MPNYLVGKVLIKSVVDDPILMKSIGLEPSSQSGIPVCMLLKSLLKIAIPVRIKDDTLLLGKMNLKTTNPGLMLLDIKKVETPASFIAANIAHIQVQLDLILGSAKLHNGAVMALVNILVDILDHFD